MQNSCCIHECSQKFSSCANIDYGLLVCTDCFIRKKANKFGRRGYQKPYVMAI